MSDIREGLRGSADMMVTGDDTAEAMGSGDVPVLATPRLLALLEAASVEAVRGALEDGATTVGTGVELDHVSPTPVGWEVHAEAVLENVNGRHLRFAVRACDARGDVALGVHHRAVVDRERFMARARGG
jgi:fluoroacetyl-CoA thioesterase